MHHDDDDDICEQGKTLLLVGILDVGFLVAAILAMQLLLRDGNTRINVLGVLCAGLNILMYGSPLAAMVSTYIPFFLFQIHIYM